MVGDLDTRRRSRLLYRSAHRGCKEMDILLGSFAQRHLHLLSEEQLARYEEITELDDDLLYAYVVGRTAIPEGVDRDLIRLIADYAEKR